MSKLLGAGYCRLRLDGKDALSRYGQKARWQLGSGELAVHSGMQAVRLE
jgi:hypothetical protein